MEVLSTNPRKRKRPLRRSLDRKSRLLRPPRISQRSRREVLSDSDTRRITEYRSKPCIGRHQEATSLSK